MRLALALLCLFCLLHAGNSALYCSQCKTTVQTAETKGCSDSECMAPIIMSSCSFDETCAGTLYNFMNSLAACSRLNGAPATCCASLALC
ncbi:unnamed protein product, partial [Mesorhabditis belari]|uniref:Uncharacterized protein n=1 Tax=Mesorhabditis belari TaxID=2138241 RepID=A0AAF3EK58_9BILA